MFAGVDFFHDQFVQFFLVYAHEIALNVQLQGIGRPSPIVRTRPDMMLAATNPLQRAFPSSAGIAVMDEMRLDDGIEIIVH